MNSSAFVPPPLILRAWFPLPIEDQWTYFYYIYIIQFYVMWLGMISVPCWHSFMVALMMYPIISMEQIYWKLEHSQVRVADIFKIFFY